jgi:PAS domain S-box-containing protein
MTTVRKVIMRYTHWVIGSVVLILAGYIFSLVASQYRSQLALQEAGVRQYIQESDNRAATIGYFLAEREGDLRELSRSRELAAYYENRGLGMSMEYGLRASIQIAADEFHSLREAKKLGKQRIFETIAFVEKDGNPLIESGVPSGLSRDRWKTYLDPDAKGAATQAEGTGPGARILFSVPCRFKGKYVGQLVAWVPLTMVLEAFVSGGETADTAAVSEGKFLYLTDGLKRRLPAWMTTIPSDIPFRKMHHLDGDMGSVILTPVEKSPFVLMKYVPPEALRSPQRLLHVTAGTAILMLIGGFFFLHLATRYAVLQARLEETTLREQAVDEKNAELRSSEEMLHQANRTLETLIETSPLGIVALDEKGTIVLWNRTASKTFGYPCNGYGGTLEPLFAEEGDYESFLTALRTRQNVSYPEQPLLHREGSRMMVNLTAARLPEGTGDATHVVMVEDVTQRVELEEQLDRARKLESLGSLAGGIAHDFNNMLSGILGNVSVAKLTVTDPEARALLVEAEKACMRASALTKQLLTFSRGGAPVKSLVSLAAVVEANARFALSGSGVRLEVAVDPGVGSVEVDEGQIGQVINNLAINAAQAMPHGGTLLITCGRASVGAGSALSTPAGDYTTIAVSDDGPGIPPHILTKIFDPYFTTKKGGTGLGLATVYSIVKRHGGHISVNSSPGKGTTFTIYLPGVFPHVVFTPEPPAARPPGQGRVLVVDDNVAIRRSVGAMLTRIGYRQESAENGEEGISLFREGHESGDPFALVLMDLTIPGGMGGEEAVKELLAIDPEAKVVVTSGYADDPIVADYRAYGFSGVITKPFLFETLAETLASVLMDRKA